MRNTRPLCGLCQEPKEIIRDIGSTHIYYCLHCDTTVNCKGASVCGACKMGRDKNYPNLPDVKPL